MTDGFVSPDPIAWEHAVAEFKAARAANDQDSTVPDPMLVPAALTRLFEAEEALMAQPAPDIDAVIEKLLVIWADEFEVITPDSYAMMQVIGDLRRLSATAD